MGGDAVFVVRGITKRYADRKILDNVSFEVTRGEILGLIGASGTGKTTLLHMLVGFLPANKGDILFRASTPKGIVECDVAHHQDIVSRSYGFASQHPSFYERLTVLENLNYFGSLYDMDHGQVAQNAEVLLKLLQLKAHSHVLAQHLSGGMQRRLDIACALIHNPPVLILDEPTSDLDPVIASQVWEVLKRINARGTTIILSSHHLNELDAICSRIGILKDGSLIDIDQPAKLKTKYISWQELVIESFPGNYDRVIQHMHPEHITSIKRQGTALLIRTERPDLVIGRVLGVLHKMGESLLDLRLVKPNLDTVFAQIHTKHSKTEHKQEQVAQNSQKKSEHS